MNNRHILARAVANGQPMSEQQRRAMWAKRSHPQQSNPQLMELRPAGSMSARPIGPQPDIVTRPADTHVKPVARFAPPAEHATAPLESTPALRQWLEELARRRRMTGRPDSGLSSHPAYDFRPGVQPPGSIGVPHVLPINLPNLPRQHHLFNRAAAALQFLSRHGELR